MLPPFPRKWKRKPRTRERAHYKAIVETLRKPSEDSRDWRYKRRGTVLGVMHAEKKRLWMQLTESCPYQGLDAEALESARTQ